MSELRHTIEPPRIHPAKNALYDLVVIGAGLAGCLTALATAKQGARVLLVDAKPFGRAKVCGGCLNQTAWQVLEHFGLDDVLRGAGSQSLTALRWICHSRQAEWPMPIMHSISRQRMDTVMVRAAIEHGVTYCDRTHATVLPMSDPIGQERLTEPARLVALREHGLSSNETTTVRAHVVVAADGLGHPSLAKLPEFASHVATDSRVGVGATFASPSTVYGGDLLTMVTGQSGYVGFCRVEENLLNVAAAFDASALKPTAATGSRANRLAAAVAGLLKENGLPLPEGLMEANWTGTPPLTRRSQALAGHRLLLVGDSASYVEPFTGEGMAWALKSAALVSPIALEGVAQWSDHVARDWTTAWKTQVYSQQRICRFVAGAMRRPRLTSLVVPLLNRIPNLPARIFPHRRLYLS
jgi:flavin-dependent dehydrogenase